MSCEGFVAIRKLYGSNFDKKSRKSQSWTQKNRSTNTDSNEDDVTQVEEHVTQMEEDDVICLDDDNNSKDGETGIFSLEWRDPKVEKQAEKRANEHFQSMES